MTMYPETDRAYLGLSEHLRNGAREWIEGHHEPGGFLMAVIENNLLEAAARADLINRPLLASIVLWFYNEAPSACRGSPAKAAAWLARGDDR